MKTLHLIFPVGLYKKNEYLNDKKDICIYEDPIFFTKFKFHKMKLLFHRITMKKYFDFITNNNKKYIDFNENIENIIKKYDVLEYYYPYDHEINKKYQKICKKHDVKLIIYEGNNFFLSMKEIADYNKPFYHDKTFYPFMRKKLNIFIDKNDKPLYGKYSFDKDNRKKIELPLKIKKIIIDKYIKEAQNYINKNFEDNYGNFDNMIYPTTHKDAEKLLINFCKNKLANFGTYEDAIDKNNSFLYHSQLSSSLNIGLLTDKQVVKYVLQFYEKYKIEYNNIEGFIRQIIGWRNYVFLIYEKIGEKIRHMNFLNHNEKLSEKFYNATTEIPIIDDCINKALKYCYLNHIERLMVIGNFMLLCEIKPIQVMKWYFELVSIDAYDIFMVPNVLSMSQYADGGIMMNRLYYCSSNYLLKMSNYKKNKDKKIILKSGSYDWTYIIDCLYYRFIYKHKDILSKIYSSAYSVLLLKNKNLNINNKIKIANEYLKKLLE